MNLSHSPVHGIQFHGIEVFVKRDDLLDQQFNGNKARKFFYYLNHTFPTINRLVSYGSIQSNCLYTLSVLSKIKGWRFDYYVDYIPLNLEQQPLGNYKEALINGTNIHIIPKDQSKKDFFQTFVDDPSIIFIPEGGATEEAKEGVQQLASEIDQWTIEHNVKNLKIFLPSGTGTTSAFLQESLPQYSVLTVPCVGNASYLREQWSSLGTLTSDYPTILNPNKSYRFGQLYVEFFQLYLELLEQTQIEFDLLYDPLGWMSMIEYLNDNPLNDGRALYIHQGGTMGNITMKQRYEKYLSH